MGSYQHNLASSPPPNTNTKSSLPICQRRLKATRAGIMVFSLQKNSYKQSSKNTPMISLIQKLNPSSLLHVNKVLNLATKTTQSRSAVSFKKCFRGVNGFHLEPIMN